MQLPCSFNLRAFAHAITLHGMPLIHLPSPKLIDACLSSLLCEDFPDYPLWISQSQSATRYLVLHHLLFWIILWLLHMGSSQPSYTGVLGIEELHVARICTHPHWHTLMVCVPIVPAWSHCTCFFTEQQAPATEATSTLTLHQHFIIQFESLPLLSVPLGFDSTTDFPDECLPSWTTLLTRCPTLGKPLFGSRWSWDPNLEPQLFILWGIFSGNLPLWVLGNSTN